ncbi:tyrosine-type recombinase/integrase [Nonomuraea sp. PA05]|nr:tyrosine-type recombinase/integrase [Nonomuraea sp. PA05]
MIVAGSPRLISVTFRPGWLSATRDRRSAALNTHPDVLSALGPPSLPGYPPIQPHDLRHGAATLSLAAGNDMKVTSAMLRHAGLAMTSDLYTAVLPDVAHAAAEASAALAPRTAASRKLSATPRSPSHHPAHRRRQEVSDMASGLHPQDQGMRNLPTTTPDRDDRCRHRPRPQLSCIRPGHAMPRLPHETGPVRSFRSPCGLPRLPCTN